MAEMIQIDIEIPKKGYLNIDADIPEKETIEVTPREQSFIYHDELFHRDVPDQHPIGAITNLETELNKKATKQELDSEIERATRAEQELDERIDNIPQPDLSPYAKKSELAEVATSGKYQDLSGQPTIPSQASDVHALPDTTKYGSNLSLGINPTTFVMTLQLKDQDGNNIGSAQSVDLPLESVVVGGRYDDTTKKVILTLENGSTIEFSVADLVAGLQTEITAQNKLNADYVDDSNSANKFTTTQEKATWNGKQDAINDLETIRSGASAGATAVQPSAIANMQTTDNMVQTVRASSSAETTKYPSEKAVALKSEALQDAIDQEVADRFAMDNTLSDRIDDVEDNVSDSLASFVKTTDTIPITNYDLLDVPVQYKGATNQNYINGYFYKFTNPVYSSTVTVQTGSFTVTIDNAKFISRIKKTGRQFFSRKDSFYWYNSTVGEFPYYFLDYYGITINGTANTGDKFYIDISMDTTITRIDVQPAGNDGVPYTGATQAVDLNAQDLKNVDNLAVGTSTVDNNEKILSVGQNRFVSNNNNGLFISSTTSQTRKGMYGVPMALEIQFNSNNQAYSYPLGFHDMNSNNNGGQFLFTSFSSAIGAASAGDVMVENDKGGLIFNTGNSKSGAKMRFTVGNWQSTPQLTLTANGVGVKTLNPNSSYAMDVNGTLNATNILINGQPIDVGGDANVQYVSGGGTETIDLSQLYIDSQGATYSFSYDDISNTIKNDNVQVDNSYAYAFIELNLENDGDVTISFTQDSEQNYDFGEISELDQYLTQDNQQDTDYVAWSGKEYSSVSDSITFSNVTAGYHFFTIKYIKDSSTESGSDTFEITGIEISGGSAGSLVDTDTQEEIPLSQINDMPQALQAIRDEIPDTSNFVTIDTKQMMTAPKAITGTDTPWGSDQVQKNLFMAVSNSNTTSVVEWIGRSMFGANNLTFLMGTINRMAALGAHSWTSAKQGTGAAWADMYFNPDGDKAVKIGGSPMVGRPSIMVIQNLGQTTTGTVKINRRPLLTQSALYKDVACWDDDVTKFDFTKISGYNASVNQTLTHDSSGNLKWVNS